MSLAEKPRQQKKQAEVPEQVAQSKRQQLDTLRSQKDPFYEAKKAADASAAMVPGMPRVDISGKNQYADEKAFIQYKARKEGMGEGQYKRALASKVADKATSLQRDYTGRKEEFKQGLVARRESFQGIDKSTDVGQAQFNTAVSELAKEIQSLNIKIQEMEEKVDKLSKENKQLKKTNL